MKKSVTTAGISSAVALALLVSGCSSKATGSGEGSGGDGDLKTDYGVTADTITLGALTDSSGPFKVGGVLVTHGNELWAKEVNAAGGICGRDIELDIRDTAYKADLSVPAYDAVSKESVGLIQIIGSAVFAALKQKMVTDQTMGSSPTIASLNLDTEVMIGVGPTFDVEAINGLAYMQQEGMLNDGDTVGIIYLDNEAGQNALAGVEAYAEQHDLNIIGSPAAPSDTDMTAIVTKFKSEGVNLVYSAMTPAATASAAVQMKAQVLDVPIMGFNSSFQPSVLSDESVISALENFYFLPAGRVWASDAEGVVALREQYEAAGIGDEPAASIITGYLSGLAWGAILEQACEDGDMTRPGLIAARKKVTELDTQGLASTLDLSDPGNSPTRSNIITKIDPSVPGGLVEVSDFFESDEAKEYELPYQK